MNRYEIRIRGTLSPEWAEWFDGMEIRQRGLNLTLISVNPSNRAEPAGPRESQGE